MSIRSLIFTFVAVVALVPCDRYASDWKFGAEPDGVVRRERGCLVCGRGHILAAFDLERRLSWNYALRSIAAGLDEIWVSVADRSLFLGGVSPRDDYRFRISSSDH